MIFLLPKNSKENLLASNDLPDTDLLAVYCISPVGTSVNHNRFLTTAKKEHVV